MIIDAPVYSYVVLWGELDLIMINFVKWYRMCALEPAQIVVIIISMWCTPNHCHYLISRAISAILIH